MQCTYCGSDVYNPFRCAYCGNYYCGDHRVPESHRCVINRRVMNVPGKPGRERGRWPTARWAKPQVQSRPNQSGQTRRRWGYRLSGYHRRLRVRKSYVFLLIWVVGFALGLYLDPGLSYITLIGISLLNTIVVSIFVFGIAGIIHRGIGHKVFGILLIMVLVGFLYQNPAVLGSINSPSIARLYSTEGSYIASIPASFQNAGSSNTGSNPIGNIISSVQGPTINAQWISQFMASVNSARQSQGLQAMVESSSLDSLAQQRLQLETEGTNWEITHYGYQDLPPGVGEVVFYPDGYTPSSYASNIQSTAPLHWNLLMDSSFSSYGFAVGQGTTLGVYQPCSATELPGPGINITQWFAQHGCQTVQETSTWLVIDMS
jgi:AN1-like Zinc finger